jgi:hypothetical protein
MEVKKLIVSTVAGVALCGSLLSAPAFAEEKSFGALQGVEAQALSATEMAAIEGQAIDISNVIATATALLAKTKLTAEQQAAAIAKLTASLNALAAKFPRLFVQ